ncbi:SAM-dependent methyltransferase [Rhodoblastus sphagnicola]|nr:class I SAM-dependent methyltransferase [Rhodoblastus sphagnicola]MBB4200114.1 SAM-dependent methyltransferase [Rhodoblastus sphagnicola]
MFAKTFRYIRWFAPLSFKLKRYEIARRIFPSAKRQYELDSMVGPWGYWEELRHYQITALKTFGMMPHHRLLDIGCGPLQGGIAFIRYLDAVKYTGIDISQKSLDAGLQLIEEAGLSSKEPVLLRSDSFGKNELTERNFDYIWCSQMLYHLDEGLLEKLMAQVAKFLAPDGRFYGDIIGYPNEVTESSSWNGFPFYMHTAESVEKIARRSGLTVRNLGQISSYGYPSEVILGTNNILELAHEQPLPRQ